MKASSFAVFLTVFLTLYGLVNFYIYYRAGQLIPAGSAARPWFIGGFIFVALSYIGGRLLEKFTVCTASDAFIWIGSIWLGLMAYLAIGFLVADLLHGAAYLAHLALPGRVSLSAISRQLSGGLVVAIAAVTVAAGYVNAANPLMNRLELEIKGKRTHLKSLNIALATDIHLGVIIGNGRFAKLVDRINELNPDIILLAGDIVDEDIAPVIEENVGEKICMLKAKYGVYAVTGNHEYIGGVDEAVSYLVEHGITMLRDEAAVIDNAFVLAGREDLSGRQFSGTRRKPLANILAGHTRDLPVILMDHQPFGIPDAIAEEVDLLLCGHTHHGQLWPFNYITSMIYEVSRGYRKFGSSHVYVSCGFGTWGPPVRTGNRPEIVNILVKFSE
ncbi:MAG: metallophosphoesterase [Spirochaetes bacterium]|nr:MAG: metallophosphoesterase [Spirochaetota bacterium]